MKIFLFILALISYLNGSTYSFEKKYSKNQYQYKTSISYIDTNITFIQKFQQPYIKRYKNKNPKMELLEMLTIFDYPIQLFEDTKIDIFSHTKNSITLKVAQTNYYGGAHGSYEVSFFNFYKQKEIKLNDIIKDQNKLLKIAKEYYKYIYNIQNKPLTANGWFEDKFILPNNFALLENGILFYYNSYEIKPYSFGHTKFILPYYKIKDILKIKFTPHPYIFQSNIGEIKIYNKKNNIYFKIKNTYYTENEKIYLKINNKTIIKNYKNLPPHTIKTITIKKDNNDTLIELKAKFDNDKLPNEENNYVYPTQNGLVYKFSL